MPALSKEFLDIQATVDCRFTPKRVLDMTRTYRQSLHTYFTWYRPIIFLAS